MKKVIVVLSLILVVAIIGIGVYWVSTHSQGPIEPPAPPVEDSGNKTPAEKVDIKTKTTESQTLVCTVHASIPQFSGLTGNFAFQENINAKINSSIRPYIEEISIVADESAPDEARYRYNVDYERFNNDNYISLLVAQEYVTSYEYGQGLRSTAWKDTYNVDIVNCRELTLADVCSSRNYKKIIVAEVNKQAEQRNIKLNGGEGLTDIPDSQRFYIKDQKLYIYFEPASIALYLDGEMHFEMPYTFLDGKFILE